ncbi:hypothetical protein M7I_5381 [Glarea lozoyensis 74030]|uniref:Uncharacterized protein n=1 Tax=Glarea lozoyensis (strain ATCC 74030 / MF5533) TaxID=1104152 RepID=H0ERR0_GLAL7|nr:hypothetical protein M7I_5381 [Glarea lozoyensis 74030]
MLDWCGFDVGKEAYDSYRSLRWKLLSRSSQTVVCSRYAI